VPRPTRNAGAALPIQSPPGPACRSQGAELSAQRRARGHAQSRRCALKASVARSGGGGGERAPPPGRSPRRAGQAARGRTCRDARRRVTPPPRTKWTRRVPHPVLIGHAASRTTRGMAAVGRRTQRAWSAGRSCAQGGGRGRVGGAHRWHGPRASARTPWWAAHCGDAAHCSCHLRGEGRDVSG